MENFYKSERNEEVAFFKKILNGFLEGGMKKLKEMIDFEINKALKLYKIEISIDHA